MYLTLSPPEKLLPGFGSSVLIKSPTICTWLTDMPRALATLFSLFSPRSSRWFIIMYSVSSSKSPLAASCMVRHSLRFLAPTPRGSKVWMTSSISSTLSSSVLKAFATCWTVTVRYPLSSMASTRYLPIFRSVSLSLEKVSCKRR